MLFGRIKTGATLQWGRRSMAAETLHLRDGVAGDSLLQWGRRSMAAETR